jgi:hypothetical protein
MAQAILEEYSKSTKAGDTVTVVVNRPQEDGSHREISLSAPAMTLTKPGLYSLSFAEKPSFEQLKLRNQWLQAHPVTARPEDVASIDAILGSLYAVISGPAGERDWDRFHSLFADEAIMGAMSPTKSGQLTFKRLSPEEYQQNNAEFFMKNGFWESELGRELIQYGELATVMSAYEFRLKDQNSEPAQRGVNNIQLVFDQGRWWITSLIWNAEREENPIPENLLSQKESTRTQK